VAFRRVPHAKVFLIEQKPPQFQAAVFPVEAYPSGERRSSCQRLDQDWWCRLPVPRLQLMQPGDH
jgi:hypothetical protein